MEADVFATQAGFVETTRSSTAIRSAIDPCTTPIDTKMSSLAANRIAQIAARQVARKPVTTPFVHITKHIVEPPGVRFFDPHRPGPGLAAGILFMRPFCSIPARTDIADAAVA